MEPTHFKETWHTRKAATSLVQAVVAYIYDVPLGDLCAETRRGSQTALARQVAMYLDHVVCRLSLTEVAEAFGRDRTTASHACHRIEDLRDDPAFDRHLSELENLLRAAARIEVTQ